MLAVVNECSGIKSGPFRPTEVTRPSIKFILFHGDANSPSKPAFTHLFLPPKPLDYVIIKAIRLHPLNPSVLPLEHHHSPSPSKTYLRLQSRQAERAKTIPPSPAKTCSLPRPGFTGRVDVWRIHYASVQLPLRYYHWGSTSEYWRTAQTE